MCELLGMSANVPTDICFSFTGLMLRGGKTGPHKDGWGITFYEGRGFRTFKDPEPSAQSPIAKLVQALPIKSRAVVSHIRQANRGCVSLENTHPFTRELWGRYWTFAHNGQLTGYKRLPTGRHRPVGDTDSEHAFCWLLDRLEQKYPKRPAFGSVPLASSSRKRAASSVRRSKSVPRSFCTLGSRISPRASLANQIWSFSSANSV